MNEEKDPNLAFQDGPVTPPPPPDVQNARRREVCNPATEYEFAYGQAPHSGCGYDPRQNPLMPDVERWGQRPVTHGSNGMGVAGFVLAMVSVFGTWLPYVGVFTWLLGLIFSCIGLTRRPRGLAVAGLVISLLWMAVWVVLVLLVGIAVFSERAI